MKKKNIIILIVILISISSFTMLKSIKLPTVAFVESEEQPYPANNDPIEELWNRTYYAGDFYSTTSCSAIELDSAENIYLAGEFSVDDPYDNELAIMKYDKDGVFQWNRSWDTYQREYCNDLAIDSSGNAYMAGWTYAGGVGSDRSVALVKYDPDGVEQWSEIWHYILSEECYALTIDSSDNIIIVGYIDDGGPNDLDVLLLVYNSTGDYQWHTTWGGDGNDIGYEVALDELDNIYITGYSNDSLLLVKFNNSGVEQWNCTFEQHLPSSGHDLVFDSSNNIFVSGEVDQDLGCLIKFDDSGVFQWNRTFGIPNWGTHPRAIMVDALDNVYIAGYRTMYTMMLKYSNSGNLIWEFYYDLHGFESCLDATMDSVGNFYLAGPRRTGFNKDDFHFAKFRTVPMIAIHSPLMDEVHAEIAPNFNISFITDSINATWYTINSGSKIPFTGTTGVIDSTAWTSTSDGAVFIEFFLNNTAGYMALANVTVYKDTLAPSIAFNSPTPYQYIDDNAPVINLTIDEPNLDTSWYSLDEGSSNFTFTGSVFQINQSEWDKKVDGEVSIQFYANDTLGHVGFNELNLTKDATIPLITINNPLNDAFYSDFAPNFDLSITELNVDVIWYTLDNGMTNITFTGTTGQVNQTEWDKLADGIIPLYFYVKDAAGNIGQDTVDLNKDAELGQIVINSPASNQFVGAEAPIFALDIEELHLNTTWYSLDDGATNYTFSSLSGQVDQGVWDIIGEGLVTLRFFVNSTLGNEGTVAVALQKDLTAPSSVLSFTPYQGSNTVLKTTTFTLSAEDGTGAGISVMRYKIDDTVWIEYSGPFTLSTYEYGTHIITYYAVDSVNNTEMEHSISVELISETGIPGFDLYILLSCIGVISAVLILKRPKKIK